ncbi:hypothetical protein Hanom_Chr09g00799971 [Helianthus anomalus]
MSVPKGQTWVVKKQTYVSDNKKENVFEKNERNHPLLPGKIYVQLPKSKHAWVDLFK